MPPFVLLLALVQQAPLAGSGGGAASGPRAPYWQQEVRYDITARLDETRGVLEGEERIHYFNRSPDTLRTFALHLYLNAFRPGSRWAAADSVERRRRFNDLQDPDYGYNHVWQVRIGGRAVEPRYPLAPDSTIVRFLLPAPLPPGDSLVVDLAWDARPSTVPRRQGRRGRHYDFAQWYPRVVTYDRYGWNEHALYPAGEFYGEFGSFLVQLDLPEDQVVGATGVPVCGDPGWAGANQVPERPPRLRRDHYPAAREIFDPGDRCGPRKDGGRDLAVGPGRKKVVWYADDVHHFALSMNPAYRYEGGWWGDVAIHVLYRPGDEETWGRGIAVRRTAIALEWLDGLFGPFAWPQITTVHRIEAGGTEFPMMMHNGSADQGLIVHELGHNYLMGILANNEWREGWLDEGFSSYQDHLFYVEHEAGGSRESIRRLGSSLTALDLDGLSEPASLVSESYRDFTSYGISVYNRGEWFFHQLEYLVGRDTMRRILRTYYDRWKLKHVDEDAFREVAEEVAGRDLKGFFAEALHGTALVDYGIGRVRVEPGGAGGGGGWNTKVEVRRKAAGHRPVDVWVLAELDTAVVRADGLAERAWVEVDTRSRPRRVRLDPEVMTGDWNLLDNERRLGPRWLEWLVFGNSRPRRLHLDTWFSTPVHRDRIASAFMPVAWYNDAGGITLGVRHRQNYFGRFEQNVSLLTWSTGWESDRGVEDADFFTRLRNPTWLRSPGLAQTLEWYNVEGRFGARLALEKTLREHLSFGPVRRYGVTVQWLEPDDVRYLDPGYYEDAGLVEARLDVAVSDRPGPWRLGAYASAGAGLVYGRAGLAAIRPGGAPAPFYGRGTVAASARREFGGGWLFGIRLAAAGALSDGPALKQRQAYAAGADPLEQFGNPLLRSRGALLVRPDVNYHAAGGANLRGFDPRLSARGLVGMNLELERTLFRRPGDGVFQRAGLAAFGDVGHTLQGRFSTAPLPGPAAGRFLADGGVGIRSEHRIGETSFMVRLDFPLWVNRPAVAQDTHPGGDEFGLRWLVGVGAIW
jgi:hypothetical protein